MRTLRSLRGWLSSSSPSVLAALGALAIVLVLGLTLVGFRLARPGVLPGVTVADEPVGGHDRQQLENTVTQLAEQRGQRTVTVILDDDDDRSMDSQRADLGYQADVEAAIDEAWRRGRQVNPFAAMADHLRAFNRTIAVSLDESVDDDVLDGWVALVADALDREPVEGDIEITGTDVAVVEPAPGAAIDRDSLTEQGRTAATAAGASEIVAQSVPVAPATDADNIAEVADRARLALSAPVRLVRNDAALELDAAEIGELVFVERAEDDDEVTFDLSYDPEALDVDDDTIAALETDPVDARIQLSGGEIEITPSTEGFRFDREIAATQVFDIATTSDDREADLDGETAEPELTTEEAEALEITERVSTFTTNHACCQGRVQNIQRMADMVRGVVLRPGEEFSINEHVGPRTEAKGFTDGGIILRGEFEEAVGGGVSQFATTFFNAAYEGGYDILEHRPHSYYISRYPMGREATLNYPNLDVRIRNDSPYGLLLHTRYTGTSITVDFYGKKWADVSITTGPRREVRSPPEEYEENSDLEPGTERVIQEGREGFLVSHTRRRTFLDGSPGDEVTQSWRYTPEPRIIERNTSEPEPEPEEEDEDEDDEDDDDD